MTPLLEAVIVDLKGEPPALVVVDATGKPVGKLRISRYQASGPWRRDEYATVELPVSIRSGNWHPDDASIRSFVDAARS